MPLVWGAVLAFASAATFGFNNAALRRGVLHGTALQALALTVPIGIPLFLIDAWLSGELVHLSRLGAPIVLTLAAAGILHFGIGRYANYRATQAMGSNLSGAIQELNVVVSLLLAFVFLRERLSLTQAAGIVLIFLATFIVRTRPDRLATATFTPDVTRGWLYSLLTALSYGTTPVLVRASLSSVNLPMAAGLVSYLAAALGFAVFVLVFGSFRQVVEVPRTARQWFLISGVFVGISQVFRYAALSLAPVTIVAPIQRLSLLFRVTFSTWMNREHEAWNARIALAILIALIGGVAVALG